MMLSDIILAVGFVLIVLYGYHLMKRLDAYLYQNFRKPAEKNNYTEHNG